MVRGPARAMCTASRRNGRFECDGEQGELCDCRALHPAVIGGIFGFVFWFTRASENSDRKVYRIVFVGSVSGLSTVLLFVSMACAWARSRR